MFNAKVTPLSSEMKPAADVVEIAREVENSRAGTPCGQYYGPSLLGISTTICVPSVARTGARNRSIALLQLAVNSDNVVY